MSFVVWPVFAEVCCRVDFVDLDCGCVFSSDSAFVQNGCSNDVCRISVIEIIRGYGGGGNSAVDDLKYSVVIPVVAVAKTGIGVGCGRIVLIAEIK